MDGAGLRDLALVISEHANQVYENVKEADEQVGRMVNIASVRGIPVGLIVPSLNEARAQEANRKEAIVLFYEASRLAREARSAMAMDLAVAAAAMDLVAAALAREAIV
jgi:hypothetical protein